MIPGWLPDVAVTYLAHTSAGLPIRALARAKGCHASTVLRQVRRVEAWRDDPLVDEALERIGRAYAAECAETAVSKELPSMPNPAAKPPTAPTRASSARRGASCAGSARRAPSWRWRRRMEKAVVLREVVPGRQNRIAVVDRDVAHAFALQEWIACERAGKIACYAITAVGRAALKRLLTEERVGARAEGRASPRRRRRSRSSTGSSPSATVMAEDGSGERKLRFNLAESPLSVLGRKRDKDGAAYLTADLIEAGERLREDFELAQMGPRVAQNWERFLTAGGARGARGRAAGRPRGRTDARVRVAKAMEALGPGLSDIVFRICCFLEGLETAEKRLGWSARSGKVVLKIALERLAAHYRHRAGGAAPARPAESAGGGDDRRRSPPPSARRRRPARRRRSATAKISAALPGLTEPP